MKQQIKSYDDSTFLDVKAAPTPSFEEARELAYKFTEHAFENIREFPYVYFTDGATGAINSIIPKYESVMMDKNDYRYVRCFKNVTTKPSQAQYFSYPFSGDGTYRPIPEGRVILDCSYVFASNMDTKPIPENVDYAIFSLSKSHNLSTLRCGWFFSRVIVPEFQILQYQSDYGSSVHVAALREAIKLRPNELYLRHKTELSEKYKKVGATEGATNLFGVLSGDRIPYYVIT